MKKNFDAVLKQNPAFDGISISQTEEERETNALNSNNYQDNSKIIKKQHRISLYMEEGDLLRNLNAYCQVHGVSKNKFIIGLIEDFLTVERMNKVKKSLEALN